VEFYEDIHGYEGSADWTMFYAVFYTTDAFLTRAQVEAEWNLTGVPHSWKVMLITGRGDAARKRAATKKAASRKRAAKRTPKP
jgi:hypothetical protein